MLIIIVKTFNYIGTRHILRPLIRLKEEDLLFSLSKSITWCTTDDGTLRFVPEGCIVLILMLKTGRGDGYPVFHGKGFKTFSTEFACKTGWNEAYRSLSIRYSSVLQQTRPKKPASTTESATVNQLEQTYKRYVCPSN
jgi:hypothetical protein